MWVRILLPLLRYRLRFSDVEQIRPIASTRPDPLTVKMRKFINYLKESFVELTKKVTWPSWSKLQNSAILVMVASVILAVIIFCMDFVFQKLMTLIYSL